MKNKGKIRRDSPQLRHSDSGIATHVRGPANYSYSRDYEVLEGVIETEHWFGPLFTNIRLHKRNKPIIVRADKPLLQVQPFSMTLYKEHEDKSSHSTGFGLSALTEASWKKYANTVVRRMKTRESLGDYAKESRKNRNIK